MQEELLLKKLEAAQEKADHWFSKYEGQKQETRILSFENGKLTSYIQELEHENKALIAEVKNLENNTRTLKAERREDREKIHREELYQQKTNELKKRDALIKQLRSSRDVIIAENQKLRKGL